MQLKDFDFRIWNKDEETLTYASKDYKLDIGFSNPQQDYGVCESELHAYYDGEPMCPSDCEIELWSGFYDKNGTKIYEGDIVKYRTQMQPLVVVFERNTFYIIDTSIEKDLQVDCGMNLQRLYENRDKGYTNQKVECLQVIGNIHENADLL